MVVRSTGRSCAITSLQFGFEAHAGRSLSASGRSKSDAGRAVGVHLHAGDQRRVEVPEDERVQHMQVGVKLPHELPERRIDLGLDLARDLDAVGKLEPERATFFAEAGDGHLAAAPPDKAQVWQLPTATGGRTDVAKEERRRAVP